jgi:hypothetical protein
VGEAYGFASHAGEFGGSWQSLELLLEYICSRRVMFAELRNAWLEGKAAMQGVGQEGTIHDEMKLEPELRTGKTLCYCVEVHVGHCREQTQRVLNDPLVGGSKNAIDVL